MKVMVIGKKHVSFDDEKGKHVEFHKVFATHKNPYSDNITEYDGIGCSEITLPENIWKELVIDSEYLMEFDRKGKLLEVSEI